MNRNKSTHRGTCQACGSIQKLPGGKLSTHGYTVKWGFFSGICHGAGELPFEQSKDLVESCIKRAHDQIKSTKETQAALRAKKDGKAWVSVYAYGVSHYEECEIVRNEDGYSYTALISDGTPKGKRQRQHSYSGEYPKTVAEFCRFANERRAKSFDHTISQLAEYIRWQTARVENWAPTPLMSL